MKDHKSLFIVKDIYVIPLYEDLAISYIKLNDFCTIRYNTNYTEHDIRYDILIKYAEEIKDMLNYCKSKYEDTTLGNLHITFNVVKSQPLQSK